MVRWTEQDLADLLKRDKLKIAQIPGTKLIPKIKKRQKPPLKSQNTKGCEPIERGDAKQRRCLDCGNNYESRTNRRRFTEMIDSAPFDYFICACGHKYPRYDL